MNSHVHKGVASKSTKLATPATSTMTGTANGNRFPARGQTI